MGRRPRGSGPVDSVVDPSAPMRVTRSPTRGGRTNKQTLAQLFGGLAGVALKLGRKHYVSGEELAAAIEASPGEILPDVVRDYLCRYLRGQVKKKPGPQKSGSPKFSTEALAAIDYEYELRRLQAERKARGGRTVKGELAPHEEAAKIIKERFKHFSMMTPRRIANILSSRKYR